MSERRNPGEEGQCRGEDRIYRAAAEISKVIETITEIRNKIEAVQKTTSNTVDEIDSVNRVIQEVHAMTETVASAVEEQSVTTQEIAGNVAQT